MAFGTRDVTLVVKVLADVAKAQKGLKETEGFVGRAGSTIQGLAVPAGVALGAIGLLGAKTADAASDIEQSFGAVESVYKDNADQVKAWARDSAQQTGLATADYAQMSAQIGAQLKNMGVPFEDVAGQTNDLINLASDLSAQFGGSTSEAVVALSALLRGERDPIERYGVSIKQAGVDAQVAAMGLDTSTTAAKTNAQTVATLALLTQQTADAQGAFARESDTAAHAQQVANAEWTNAQAALGEALLPAVVLVSDALAAFSKLVTENKNVVLVVTGVIAVLAAGILALNVAMRVAQAVSMAFTAAQWLMNAALAANPIGLVVLAIAALVAAFVVAYNKSETFRRIVDGVFAAVKSIVKGAVDFIVGLFRTLGDVLAGPFKFFQSVVTTVLGIIRSAISAFASFVSRIFAPIKAAIAAIQSGINRIKKLIDDLPDLPKMPWDNSRSAPAQAVAVPRVRGLGVAPTSASSQAAAFGRGVTLILDGEVFGRATIGSLRRYDRRNGAAQVLPRWA